MTHVDVWVVTDLGPAAADAAMACDVLSEDELARAAGFADGPSRATFVVARTALRTILGDLTGTRPATVPLGTDATGRPIVRSGAGGGRLHVSVAHTEGCGLVAVARDGEVGVDVEPLTREVVPALAGRVCSEDEQAVLADATGEEWTRTFLRYWVRKEAVLKADGRGLRVGAGSVDVRSPGPVEVAGAADRIHVDDLDVGPAHLAAVATVGTPPAVTAHRWAVARRAGGSPDVAG